MKSKHQVAEPVSAYDAKTHLPSLIARAEKGERFVITRHGKPVAQLTPIEAFDAAPMRAALATVAKLRKRLGSKGVTLSGLSATSPAKKFAIRELTHDGHRY